MSGFGASASGSSQANTVTGVPDPLSKLAGQPSLWSWLQVIR